MAHSLKMTRKNKAARRQPKLLDHISDDSEDEEIPEDEAFNSDDERKYGSFFQKKNDAEDDEVDEGSADDNSDSDDGIASEEDDSDNGDGGQYMLDLLSKLDGSSGPEKSENTGSAALASHVKEAQFSSSVVRNAGLTLDSLMNSIQDTQGFGVVQKTMKKVVRGEATPAPLARVASERAQRKVHYQQQSKDISNWMDAVKQNRDAETLDFRPKERMDVTKDLLVEKFAPVTDFEKQIHDALQKAGQQDEEAILNAEEAALQDDLGANQISLEEYKKRRAQLAKMRALMFYHEQKRHHINKIKSKKYRRIRKKQRERLKTSELETQMEEDPDLAQELQEKEEAARMQERMTLAHKNTSKWAKRILKRGKNIDVDTRRALSAQVKRGDDLLKRMQSTKEGEEESDDDEDLVETARKVLAETDADTTESIKGKGLFQLSFMQKGIQRQREQAREEARRLLQELEESERIEENSGSDDEEKKPKKSSKIASKKEMKGVLGEGELVASSLKFGKSNSLSVSGGIDIDTGLEVSQDESQNQNSMSEHQSTLNNATAITRRDASLKEGQQPDAKSKKQKTENQTRQLCDLNSEESNPWLLEPKESSENEPPAQTTPKALTTQANVRKRGMVDVKKAVELVEQVKEEEAHPNTTSHQIDPNKKSKITSLTQEELVQRAFVSSSDQDIEKEFALEKAEFEGLEDPSRKKNKKNQRELKSSSGWGSWTGMGAPAPKAPKSFPKHLQPPEEKLPKRKREDEKKPHVIISEKRIKRTADKYMIAEIPFPYTSREEYERAMSGGVGKEWNVTKSYKDMTRPEVMVRPGKIIQPISQKVKRYRAPAKF